MPQPNYRYTSSSYGRFPAAVKWLIISNTAVFLFYFIAGSLAVGGIPLRNHILILFSLYPEAVFRNLYVWQVVSYLFLHADIWHILFNMLALWFFGAQLERDWGSKRFLKFYFLCGIVAALCVLVVNMSIGAWVRPTLGASGAVLGVMVAFAMLYPETTVLFIVFPMQVKYMVMICVAMDLVLSFGANTGISTVAHLGGAAFGYLYMKKARSARSSGSRLLPDFGDAYRRWKLERAKKKFQVYMRKNGGRGPRLN